jgi:hypothetical protein
MANTFELTDELSKTKFEFKYSFDYINIKKITATSLMGKEPNEWSIKLANLSLLFTYTSNKGIIYSFPLGLVSHISPYHRFPIIEFKNFIVPEENKGNLTTVGDFIKELTVELKDISGVLSDIRLLIQYEYTPGVKLS